MDPAGPLFFDDVPPPFNGYNCTSASRLNRTDAKFVDVIHTDGNIYKFNDGKLEVHSYFPIGCTKTDFLKLKLEICL